MKQDNRKKRYHLIMMILVAVFIVAIPVSTWAATSLKGGKITLSKTSYTYSGNACKPSVTVTLGSKTLKKDRDYTVSYSNYIKAGTATVVVRGKGKYTGTLKKTYKIKPKSIAKATLTLSKTKYSYSGELCKPTVTVMLGNTKLRKDRDYTVSYSNNRKVGTAYAIVTAQGNYTGTIKKSFKIYPKLSATTKTIEAGKTGTIKVVGYTGDNVTVTSSKPELITASYEGSGVIKIDAHWSGSAKLSVNANGKTLSCTVTSVNKAPIEEPYVPDVQEPFDATLVHDLKVVDGKVIDLVTGNEVAGLTVVDKYYFVGDGTTKISLNGNFDETIEAVVDFDENRLTHSYPLFYTYDNTNGASYPNHLFTLQYKNGTYNVEISRCAQYPNESHYVGVNSNYLRNDGLNVYEDMPKGDVFVAISGDYTNKITHARVNNTGKTIEMGKTFSVTNTKELPWYYRDCYRSFSVLSNHKIKELKFYKGARTPEQLKADYELTGIERKITEHIVGTDGIVGLGSPFAWHIDENNHLVQDDLSGKGAGIYEVTGKDGNALTIGMAEFRPVPETAVDNSSFKSLHIINKRETMYVGKQYPLSAYPYPLDTTSSPTSDFDMDWTSSNPEVVTVIDGLLIAKKAGNATITATLRGTTVADSFTIEVKNPETVSDRVYNVPANFTSADGDTFSDTDYESTMKAIFAAITYASENGYNHVVFPKQKFYASVYNTGLHYYVPSNMTIEFPKGSELHMMFRSDMTDPTKCEFHVFEFGVPGNDYENRCENSHMIIYDYYGERYEAAMNGTLNENDYIEEYRFVEFGRKAYNCSVQITNANYAAGYFITADGTSRDPNKTDGVIKFADMASGKLNSDGSVTSTKYWIYTKNFITVPEQIKKDGYFLSADGQESYSGKYWNGCDARLYHIYWYDASKNFIQKNEWCGIAEYYEIPENAAYYKVTLQQGALPKPGTNETTASPWLQMHDDGAAKDCEILNTNLYHSATGLFSVVGETDGLWIHNNYVPTNGEKKEDARTGDFENGWKMMRHSVVSNNVFAGGEYASGGHNNFMHTNYFGNEVYTRAMDEQGHIINNRGLAFICADQFNLEMYYNTTRSYLWNTLKGWMCPGHLHKNYTKYI